jgi:CheY-like chemotaxis protein
MMQPNTKVDVLIVDNDDQILCNLQQLLESAGFNTAATWSGREALTLLRSRVFDVLLVDDYLPDLHSHNFLEQVNHLIVVMHTDPAKPADRRCYESLGVSELVDKHDAARVCEAVSFSFAEQPLVRKAVN